MNTQKYGLEEVTPFKYDYFWYVKCLGCTKWDDPPKGNLVYEWLVNELQHTSTMNRIY